MNEREINKCRTIMNDDTIKKWIERKHFFALNFAITEDIIKKWIERKQLFCI